RQERLEEPGLGGVVEAPLAVAVAEPRKQAPELEPRAVGQLGQRLVVAARQRAEGGEERRVRQLALAEVQALAVEHAGAPLRRARLELGEEARLADPGLACEDPQPGPPILVAQGGGLELGHPPRPADRGGARDAFAPPGSIALPRRARRQHSAASLRGAAGATAVPSPGTTACPRRPRSRRASS